MYGEMLHCNVLHYGFMFVQPRSTVGLRLQRRPTYPNIVQIGEKWDFMSSITARAIVVFASGVWLFSPGSVLGSPEAPKTVWIGVLATRGAQQCLKRWGPTAEYLTREIPGYSFQVRPLTYRDVAPAVARGELDFVLANPSLYIELEHLYGASRIVTLKNSSLGEAFTVYAGVIFCRAGRHDVRRLDDLKGKTFMAVEEDSFGGWQMAWRELHERGIDPHRHLAGLRFAETHDAVVHAVRDGEVDAGTVRSDTLERMTAEGDIRLEDFRVIDQRRKGKDQLPFLHSTRVYPEWPLAKARATSEQLAQQVAVALMQMSPDSPAAHAAQCAGWTIPLNYQPVHECLKELRIGPYKDYGKVTLRAALRRYWPEVVVAALLLVAAVTAAVYVMQLNRRLKLAAAGQQREFAERIRVEETLRKSEQLRTVSEKLAAVGRLAAGVAHEINNPLTGILTFAHLLKDKEDRDDQDKQDLDLIVRETTRASEIVRGLLDFAREKAAMKEPLDVNTVIRRTIQLLGNQKAFRHVAVEERLYQGLLEVDGDVNQLQQVLLNLCLNACEAMPQGGTLTISTSAGDGKVLVKVADTGCGIKPEHLDQIFEPFFTTKPVGHGTGLGLSVSYGIVQGHGGTMEVESVEGKGTKFRVILPSVVAKGSQAPNEPVDQ